MTARPENDETELLMVFNEANNLSVEKIRWRSKSYDSAFYKI